MKQKVLIIRFSSFGDIVQCMSVLDDLKEYEVHWVCRKEFAGFLNAHGGIKKIWEFDKKAGLLGLILMAFKLRAEGFHFVYDAHNNLRSTILGLVLKPFKFLPFLSPKFIRRKKNRWKRILLFKFRINKFDWPFKGMNSYREPLINIGLIKGNNTTQSWNLDKVAEVPKNAVVICPSAAWPMKRWPISHWESLITNWNEQTFVILGGPDDKFCEELVSLAPERVHNFAGKISLLESCSVISNADLVISGDTGLLHVADILGVKGLSLIGPSAFGFTSNKNIMTLEVEMNCRPCSKDGSGECSDSTYQKCMVDITPEIVMSAGKSLLA